MPQPQTLRGATSLLAPRGPELVLPARLSPAPRQGLGTSMQGLPYSPALETPPPPRPCALTAPTTRGALNRPITLHSWEPHPLHPLLPQRCQWPHLGKWQRPLPRPPSVRLLRPHPWCLHRAWCPAGGQSLECTPSCQQRAVGPSTPRDRLGCPDRLTPGFSAPPDLRCRP